MKTRKASMARMACAYFFACPGLAYGILTSRLPALKEQTGADEAQIGLLLLCLGLASLSALLLSGWLAGRWGSRLILRFGSLAVLVAVTLCGLAFNPFSLGMACVLTGFGMGLADVSMNIQGILVERLHGISCMSFMHASYSLGGVIGALTGALFAAVGLGPFENALCVLGLYACFRPWAVPKLLTDMPDRQTKPQNASSRAIPLLSLCAEYCPCLSMLLRALSLNGAACFSLL